jgi:hypothetical protein
VKNTAFAALCFECSNFLREKRLTAEYGKQTSHSSQKGNAFYQCRSKDHVSTNVIGSFRLTGNGFNSTLTDHTYTDTSTDGRKACAYCTKTGLNRGNL